MDGNLTNYHFFIDYNFTKLDYFAISSLTIADYYWFYKYCQ